MRADNEIERALQIATKNLRACYGESGIFAGLHQFHDYWVRDSFFASFGALTLGDHDIVRKNLQMYLDAQREDGLLPLRIGAKSFILRYIGITPDEGIVFGEDKAGNNSADSNPLAIICAHDYLIETKDKTFLKKYLPRLVRAADYIRGAVDDERDFSGWMDTMKKRGTVLHTNVCWYHALHCLHTMTKKKVYHDEAHKLRKHIEKSLWNGSYFSDWRDTRRRDHLAIGENALCIIWGLASREQAKKIAKSIIGHHQRGRLLLPAYPAYSRGEVSHLMQMIGLGDYHFGMAWLWYNCAAAVALNSVGEREVARDLLTTVASTINRFGEVQEVYTPDGRPIKRLLYRAEHPFAWSSGLYIWAAHEVSGLGRRMRKHRY